MEGNTNEVIDLTLYTLQYADGVNAGFSCLTNKPRKGTIRVDQINVSQETNFIGILPSSKNPRIVLK